MIKNITVKDIVLIHDQIIKLIGGSPGIREPSLLQSIVKKPDTAFADKDLYPGVYNKASALFEALCNYHVFVDGNKRTAITSLEYYLFINGLVLSANADSKEELVVNTATTKTDLAEIANWIESNSLKVVF